MGDKRFVTIASTCSVTKTTWMRLIGVSLILFIQGCFAQCIKDKDESLREVAARDYVFSVKIADGGRGVWAILTSLI